MSKQPTFGPELIGKYVNRYFGSDVEPIGRIIGLRGKSILIVQRVSTTKQTTKMEFIPGGFAAHCVNNRDQRWEFEDRQDTVELRFSKSFLRWNSIGDKPVKFYDYNF